MFAHKFSALILTALWLVFSSAPGFTQDNPDPRAQTGGAQTLEDILARQRGEVIDDQFRSDATGDPRRAAPLTGQLGTLGGVADPEFWRAFRYGSADIISTNKAPVGGVVIQDGGMRWLEWRAGPIRSYGGYMLLAMLGALLLFYLIRGKILIEGEKTGVSILRFKLIERIAHWTMAIPFVLLAFTGLSLLFGRVALIPIFGQEVYTPIAIAGKFVHFYMAWPFMLGVIASFFLWAWKNLPEKTDIAWMLKGGGLFSEGVHPSAGKFNAGEKIIFWTVIILGTLISVTGLSMLFPFQFTMFGPIFEALNYLRIPQILGFGELNTLLAPQEEMQFSQIVHSIIAFVFISIIVAHIYLGSVGMEGALESMTKGTVDEQWAKEHHDLWYEDVKKENVDKTSAE
mgnify:CR=1 FL=1